MNIAIAVAIIVALFALRVYIAILADRKRASQPVIQAKPEEPLCQAHCDELFEVQEAVSSCPKDSRARLLVEQAALILAIPRPTGIYQWREANTVDRLYRRALNLLSEARELSAQC